MAAQRPDKSNRADVIKAWGVIIGALLAFITSMTVAVLQMYSVSKDDLSKVKSDATDGMNSIERHTNNIIIPKLVETIISLRIRLAQNETEIENLKESLKETRRELMHPSWNIIPESLPGAALIMGEPEPPKRAKPDPAPMFRIPKLHVQQTAQ